MNLNICQECQQNPAVYGDGLTWSRCSACELKYSQGIELPEQQAPVKGEGFEHVTKEGLISVIMPVYMTNYSLFHYTGNAIGSLRAYTDKSKFELIIVDNGSPIQPPEPGSYYCDKLIKNEQNLGVTKAWNQGIRVSFGEYIVLLENDVLVFEGWLEGLKKYLDEGMDLVMAHPMYSLTEPFARATESKAVLDGKKSFDKLQGDSDFSCVMFKKSLYDEIGPFDEQFFNYCSDRDFLKRLTEAGKKYMIVDSVATSHLSNATGYTLPDNSEVMNQDKKKFEGKWTKIELEKEHPGFEATPATLIYQLNDLNLVRTSFTGDKIFLIKDQQTHWIKSAEVLLALGARFGQEQTIEKEEFNKYTKGEDLDMANVEGYAKI